MRVEGGEEVVDWEGSEAMVFWNEGWKVGVCLRMGGGEGEEESLFPMHDACLFISERVLAAQEWGLALGGV
jgi:hypothetical protein